jgi:hypothetical protein
MVYVLLVFLGITFSFVAAGRRHRKGLDQTLEDSFAKVTLPAFGIAGAIIQFILSLWFVVALNLDPQGPAKLQSTAQPYMVPGGNINTLEVPIVLGTLALLYTAIGAYRRSQRP